jgi:hypothetical protein
MALAEVSIVGGMRGSTSETKASRGQEDDQRNLQNQASLRRAFLSP